MENRVWKGLISRICAFLFPNYGRKSHDSGEISTFYGERSRQIPDGNAPQITREQPHNGLIHNNYWINVVRPCGQQVVFSLNEIVRFNGNLPPNRPCPLMLRSRGG